MINLMNCRILVVEDEYLIADELARMLREWGGEVVGPVPTRDMALAKLGSEHVDIALLDINLIGQSVYPVAAALEQRGVPFMFVTGYSHSSVRADFANTPYLDKPFATARLQPMLAALAAEARPGRTRH